MKFSEDARRWLVRFALTIAVTALLIVTVGWFTRLRDVMHGALLSVAVVAFLPFVLVLAGIALFLFTVMLSVVAAIFGADADPTLGAEGALGLCDAGVGVAPGYYGWLARRKHPMFWGIWGGCLAGAGLLSAVLFLWVVPGESRTAVIFAEAFRALENARESTGTLPRPTEAGYLSIRDVPALENADPSSDVLLDGFGRPCNYDLESATPTVFEYGGFKLAAGRGVRFRLVSLGFDGRESADDLNMPGPAYRVSEADSGDSTIGRLTQAAVGKLLDKLSSGRAKLEPVLDALSKSERYRRLSQLLGELGKEGKSKSAELVGKLEAVLHLRGEAGGAGALSEAATAPELGDP